MGFRQNYFQIKPNFGGFGAKMSFFCYIINQKRKIFIKHCSPPRVPKHHLYQRCVSIKHTICVNGVLEHGGGAMFYRLKMGEGQLPAHEIPL